MKHNFLVTYKRNNRLFLGLIKSMDLDGRITFTTSTNCCATYNIDELSEMRDQLVHDPYVETIRLVTLDAYDETRLVDSSLMFYVNDNDPLFVVLCDKPLTSFILLEELNKNAIEFNELQKFTNSDVADLYQYMENTDAVLIGSAIKGTSYTDPKYRAMSNFVQIYTNKYSINIYDYDTYRHYYKHKDDIALEPAVPMVYTKTIVYNHEEMDKSKDESLRKFLMAYRNPSDKFLEALNNYGMDIITATQFINMLKVDFQ